MSQAPEMPEAEPAAPAGGRCAAGNWVDRFAPAAARPYLRLSRADRPIGTWLLLIPCLWGDRAGGAVRRASGPGISGWRCPAALGAFLMRGAGCTWNDITDRDIDAQVARTRSRPLPSGQVTVRRRAGLDGGAGAGRRR